MPLAQVALVQQIKIDHGVERTECLYAVHTPEFVDEIDVFHCSVILVFTLQNYSSLPTSIPYRHQMGSKNRSNGNLSGKVEENKVKTTIKRKIYYLCGLKPLYED